MSAATDPAAALAAALAAPEGAALPAAIPMPAQTAIVVDGGLGADAAGLAPLAEALAGQGIPRGRIDLVVASSADADPDARRACARAAARALGLGVAHLHDPEHGDHFAAGALAGVAIALDDVLREAEAVIVVGRDRPGVMPWHALVPGLVSAAAARALAAAPDPGVGREAVLALVRVDWAVRFGADGGPRARAGIPARVWRDAGAS